MWTGSAGDGLWFTKDNWEVNEETPEGAPGCNGFAEGAVVTIGPGDGVISAFCSGIRIERITAERSVSIDDAFEFSGPSCLRDAVLTMFNGDLIAGAQLDLSGSTVWEASGISGPGPIVNDDHFVIVGPQQFLKTRLVNLGEVTHAGGLVYDVDSPFAPHVVNHGTWELTGAGIGNFGEPRDVFENTAGGTVKKTGSILTCRFLARLDNSGGTILADENTLGIEEGGAHSGNGTYSVTNDGTLLFFGGPTVNDAQTVQLSGLYTAAGRGGVAILGNFHITSGGRLTANLARDSLEGFTVEIPSGSHALFLDGPLVNDGKMTWVQGRIAGPAKIVNAQTGIITTDPPSAQSLDTELSNFGTVKQRSNITLENGGIIDNRARAVYELIAGDIRSHGGEILNAGKILKPNVKGAGDSLIRASLDLVDGGFLHVETGTVTLAGGGTVLGQGNAMGPRRSGAALILQGEPYFVSGTLAIGRQGSVEFHTALEIGASSTVNVVSDTVPMALPLLHMTMRSGAVVKGSGTLSNSGTMKWAGGSVGPGAKVINHRHASMENVSPLTIDQGTLTNDGFYEIAGDITILGAGKYVNEGILALFAAREIRTFTVAGPFSNTGEVSVAGSLGRLSFTGPVDQLEVIPGPPVTGKLTGGKWKVAPGSSIEFDLVTLSIIDTGASWTTGDASVDVFAPSLVRGVLTIKGDVFAPANLENTGKICVEGDGSITVEGDLNNEMLEDGLDFVDGQTEDCAVQSLSTALTTGPVGGYIANNFNNHGIVLPGGRGAPGPFRLTGNFNQFKDGTLHVELGGTAPIAGHDQLTVRGNVDLAGAVEIIPLKGFLPQVGHAFDIIAAMDGTISGRLDEIVGPGQYDIVYGTDVVTATVVAIPGDSDLDEDLDLVDQESFAACLSGPGGGVRPGCNTFDFDANAAVDLRDWCAFQLVMFKN